ncbi:MAG: SpoIIE family protein phosphatase [Phycisphaerae bacterium]|nr:SpoIIE family protein phosphatase [Phycisphaerae bacterium]
MSIRWKLLVLLLVIALAPLACVAVVNWRSIQQLGRDLSMLAHRSLVERTADHLQERIRDQAAILQRRRKMLEFTLRAQAREVERHLATSTEDRPRVYFAEDYDRGVNVPPDLAGSGQHFVFVEGSAGRPIPISQAQQVFKLVPGVSRESVRTDIARLAPMADEYRFLRDSNPELIYWQVTGLESGVLTSYPGHGGYPDDYDHRQRAWYVVAKEQDRFVWIGPYFDASSQQLILTLSMPVRWPNGRFAGVTAIDVPVAGLVETMRLPGIYSGEAQSMLVALEPGPQSSARRARVVAKPGLHVRGQRWDAPLDHEWLESDDRIGTDYLLADMASGRSGVRRMPYLGRDSLWVYGPVDQEGEHLVFTVPYEEVLAEAAVAEKQVLSRTRGTLDMTGIVSFVVILAVSAVALVSSRTITKPVGDLARAAGKLARGELETRVHIKTRDELQQLGEAFNAMIPQLKERIELRQSLALAKDVQQHLLPDNPPRIEGLDVAGQSLYCDTTGGDYYDFLDMSEAGPGQLGVAIGDVTGHGVAAALLMTAARALLRARATRSSRQVDLISDLNRNLAPDMSGGRFMTLFYLVLDARAREARWISAGHDPAIVFDPVADTFEELAGDDLALGLDREWKYSEQGPVKLREGQVIFLGTDGIWEARNPQGEFFGKDAVRDVIRSHHDRRASEIGQAIVDAVNTFRQGRAQADDLTFVVVKVAKAAGHAAGA